MRLIISIWIVNYVSSVDEKERLLNVLTPSQQGKPYESMMCN